MDFYTEEELNAFLFFSNAIESEYSLDGLEDAHKAWGFLISECCKLPLEMILQTHKYLARHLRPDIAGKLRTVNVRVGSRRCPDWTLVSGLLDEWIKKWCYGKANTEEKIKQAHIEFEKIHPFEDFNGRTGRHLMNFMMVKAGFPLLIIRVGDDQKAYYRWFSE